MNKTCRKHGVLKPEDTYCYRSSSYIGCKLCKNGYKNWAVNNPDKKKAAEVKKRTERLAEQAAGTLKLHCPKHGDIPCEKIRIDSRGTKICRQCSNEICAKSHSRPEYKKRAREWLHSDPARKRRYRLNDYTKRRIRQRRRYHEIRKNPELNAKLRIKERKNATKGRERLNNHYIRILLSGSRYAWPYGDIPQDVIDLKKASVLLVREIRKLCGYKWKPL